MCRPQCGIYIDSTEVELRTRYGGGFLIGESMWAHGQNMSANGSPLQVQALGFPAPNFTQGVGKFSYQISPNQAVIAGTPEGVALGVEFSERTSQYVFPNWISTEIYNFSGAFDASQAPAGFDVQLETFIYIEFFAMWLESDGTTSFFKDIVYTANFAGSFSEEVTMNLDMNDFPVAASEYGSYSVSVSNRLVFTRKNNEVPEPSTGLLLGVGLFAASMRSRKRGARLN